MVQAGASAAVAAPLLRPGKADARPDGIYINKTKFPGKAPIITVFDHRGCKAHANKEYKGSKANSEVGLGPCVRAVRMASACVRCA